jgi:predicted Rossmann fold nucleotide-binding protein DprA/Smf involved in DNA uptake
MASRLDFVALSLTPFNWRRSIGARLRAGESPATLIRAIAPDTPAAVRTLERLAGGARAALDRSEQSAIDIVDWSDPEYPPLLAAIDDPPPVLWRAATAQRSGRRPSPSSARAPAARLR